MRRCVYQACINVSIGVKFIWCGKGCATCKRTDEPEVKLDIGKVVMSQIDNIGDAIAIISKSFS